MKQVLIVDDESRLLKSIEAGLRSYRDQFNVLTALDGRQAVDFLSREKIHLVVTDLRMPNMDGFELLAHISGSYPFMPTIVMTAFATPEIEERLNSTGTSKLLEKPIDFDRLAEAIVDGLEQEGKEGSVAGFSLANFLQLLAMEQKTCLLNVQDGATEGYIYLDRGDIKAAVSGGLKGEEALFRLLACENVRITFRKLPRKRVVKMIDKPLMSLLMEGMRRKDEAMLAQETEPEMVPDKSSGPVDLLENGSAESAAELDDQLHEFMHKSSKGEKVMAKLEDILGKLKDIDGFMGAGVFTPNGEMAGQVNISSLKLAEIGSIANDVLLKAQKATDIMHVGRGNMVHVESPKAHIFARCLNENTDFSQTESGKAHVHMVMLLEKDGNLAMGKIKLESVIGEIAAAFR